MRILNVKDSAVTRGVLDKDVHHEADLVEVTFMDDLGVPRTVFAHREGPFTGPEEIARAAIDGRLHEQTEHPPEPETPPPPQGNAFE